jgi:hypothetical protein
MSTKAHTISVECFPPYSVGQNIIIDDWYPDGKRITEEYVIENIKNTYRCMMTSEPRETLNVLTLILYLKRI